jgi:Protein of unknown function (DUF3054)
MATLPRTTQYAAGGFTLDALLTLIFVLVGRDTHAEAFTVSGILETWWPFLIGLLIGWLVTRAWRKPHGILWQGVGVWASTLIVGMLLRVLSGQGTALAFVIVASIALAVLLIGWRLIATLFTRRRGGSETCER